MDKLEYYLNLPYRMEVIPDTVEGGYAISYPDLPGCISVGESIPKAIKNAEDAKKAWLQAALEDQVIIYEPKNVNDYSGQFKLRIPRTLHMELAEQAREEGISLNQYCVYLLSKNMKR